jgi:hypothetical protein
VKRQGGGKRKPTRKREQEASRDILNAPILAYTQPAGPKREEYIDAEASKRWRALCERAGISPDRLPPEVEGQRLAEHILNSPDLLRDLLLFAVLRAYPKLGIIYEPPPKSGRPPKAEGPIALAQFAEHQKTKHPRISDTAIAELAVKAIQKQKLNCPKITTPGGARKALARGRKLLKKKRDRERFVSELTRSFFAAGLFGTIRSPPYELPRSLNDMARRMAGERSR